MSETETTHLTGYGVAKRANTALTDAGLPNIPPQMVYRYIDQNLIAHEVVGAQKLVPVADAEAWIEKYVTRRAERAAEYRASQVQHAEFLAEPANTVEDTEVTEPVA
jgi:hypothetical protein